MDQERDLVATDYVSKNYTGESYNLLFNPAHKWYFVSNQEVNETWIFKSSDTMLKDGVATSKYPCILN